MQWGFRQAKFTQAKITSLEVTVNRHTSPPTAQAKLSGVLAFRATAMDVTHENFLVKDLTVELELQSGRWLVTSFRWPDDPRGGKN